MRTAEQSWHALAQRLTALASAALRTGAALTAYASDTGTDPITMTASNTYEGACKPGQTGDGIRQTVTVSGALAPAGY